MIRSCAREKYKSAQAIEKKRVAFRSFEEENGKGAQVIGNKEARISQIAKTEQEMLDLFRCGRPLGSGAVRRGPTHCTEILR